MSSTKSNFELFLGLTRLIYVWINFGFGKSQSYIILQIIKSFNGLLILYELLNHHLIYNNSLRRLTIILAGIFVSLNVSSLFSLVLWQSKITYVDPLILPGFFSFDQGPEMTSRKYWVAALCTSILSPPAVSPNYPMPTSITVLSGYQSSDQLSQTRS